jgi:hypothetical protein
MWGIIRAESARRRRSAFLRPKQAEPHEPEPLEALLRTPMPAAPEPVVKAPAAAPGRFKQERGLVGSQIADAPPIPHDARAMVEQRRDREADQAFIKAGLSALNSEAVERARDVRLGVGDPAAQLLR